MALVRRRAHSQDRGRSASLEREEGGGGQHQKRARPVSLVRSMSVDVNSALAEEIFNHFCGAATLKSILRSYR